MLHESYKALALEAMLIRCECVHMVPCDAVMISWDRLQIHCDPDDQDKAFTKNELWCQFLIVKYGLLFYMLYVPHEIFI